MGETVVASGITVVIGHDGILSSTQPLELRRERNSAEAASDQVEPEGELVRPETELHSTLKVSCALVKSFEASRCSLHGMEVMARLHLLNSCSALNRGDFSYARAHAFSLTQTTMTMLFADHTRADVALIARDGRAFKARFVHLRAHSEVFDAMSESVLHDTVDRRDFLPALRIDASMQHSTLSSLSPMRSSWTARPSAARRSWKHTRSPLAGPHLVSSLISVSV